MLVRQSGVAETFTLDVADGAQDHDLTISGLVSDLGGYAGLRVVKTGDGTLRLTDTGNSWNGGLSINGGTVSVAQLTAGGVDGALGGWSGTSPYFSFDGGTLEYTGPTVSGINRAFTINSGGATIDVTEAATTLAWTDASGAGPIVGPGMLTKTGPGTLQLDGTLSHTGGTIVNEGTLVLNKAASQAPGNTGQFGSTGQVVTVNSGATLQLTNTYAMGDGQQHLLVANGGTIEFLNSDNYQSYITLTGGHVTTSGGSRPWRIGRYGNALITVNPSASSSTIEGTLCMVEEVPNDFSVTFDVADGTADDDLVVSALIYDHPPLFDLRRDEPREDRPRHHGPQRRQHLRRRHDRRRGRGGSHLVGQQGSDRQSGRGQHDHAWLRRRRWRLAAFHRGRADNQPRLRTGRGRLRHPSRSPTSWTSAASISGDGDFHKTGANQDGNLGNRLSLGADNTYTGDTYIDEGVLQVARDGGAIPDTSDVYISGAGNGRLRVHRDEAINGLFGDGTVQTYAAQARILTVGAADG